MRKYLVFACAAVVVAGIAWFGFHAEQVKAPDKDNVRTAVDTVLYMCDGGKNVNVTYYEGPTPPTPAPDMPPTPTGSVELSLDGGASTTLMQTLSGSGIRYANDDESFVFWSKGNEALIMRNNSMDLDYKNCSTTALAG